MKSLIAKLAVVMLVYIMTGCSNSGKVTIHDATPPSVPTDLSAAVTSATSVALNWTESTDNVGVAGYRVYRDDIHIVDSISTSCTDTGLVSSTTYSYMVTAYDAADNVSVQSSVVSITTPAVIIAGSNPNNNLTILGPGNVLGSGANDVVFTSDGTLKTSVAVSGQVSNATLSSTCLLISMPWTVHDMAIYSLGTYTVYTGCPPGSPGCGAGKAITFTVGAGEIGAHMLIDWATYKDMDVVNVWRPNAVFAPSPMSTSNCGTNPADKVWRWMSKDIDGDGINGYFIVDGVPWSINFNLH